MGSSLSFWSQTIDDILFPLHDIPLIFLQIIQYIFDSSKSKITPHQQTQKQSTNGPLLAFSYAGMLWSYYLGTVAFLRDHFNLHKSSICLTGISAGCSAVMVIFLDLTIEQGFEFGLEWNKLFNSRFLKFFALSTSQTLNMIVNKFHKFGITDQVIKQQYKKYGGYNCLHFGVTMFKFSQFKMSHELLNNFNSLKQAVYAALCSMRIVPFFRSFGFYNGYYCCDGAVTSNYSIPEIYRNENNKNKIIKIGVLSKNLVESDIAPMKNFYLNEFIVSGNLNDNLVRFNKGYKDAAMFGNILGNYIKKGLVWNHSSIGECKFKDHTYEKEWDLYVDDRIKVWNEKIIEHMRKCEM